MRVKNPPNVFTSLAVVRKLCIFFTFSPVASKNWYVSTPDRKNIAIRPFFNPSRGGGGADSAPPYGFLRAIQRVLHAMP